MKGFVFGVFVPVKSVRKLSFVKAGKPTSNGLLLGDARVSKGDDQTNIMQARALRAARLSPNLRRGSIWGTAGTGRNYTVCSIIFAMETPWSSGSSTAYRVH
jgi:hypothetical protein